MTEPIVLAQTTGRNRAARLYVLDVARLLAALMVVFYHYTVNGVRETQFTEIHMVPFAKYGYLGVDFFFIISGFVVLMSSTGRTPTQFFQSRFVRIVPMFVSACLITYIYLYFARETALLVSFRDFLLDISLLGITPLMFAFDMQHVDSVYWTLVYETIFYIMIWLALSLKLMRYLRILLVAWLALAAADTLFDLGGLSKFFTLILMSDYAPYFIAGGFFYMVWHAAKPKWTDGIVIVICLLLSVITNFHKMDSLYLQDNVILSPWVVALSVSAIFIFFAAVSLHYVPQQRFQPWAWIGALSYPLYLLHQNIGLSLIGHIKFSLPPVLTLMLVVLIVLAMSWLAHLYLERPLAKLLGQWFRAGQTKSEALLHNRR